MSQLKYFKQLSQYNERMNQRLYDAVSTLSDKQMKENKNAFFKSLFGTLNHIIVGDIIWLNRFATSPSSKETLSYFTTIEKPPALNSIIYTEFNELRTEREKIDQLIINWVHSLTEKDLCYKLAYKNMNNDFFSQHFASLIHHLFLHQVHHRGQATTLLSQFGVTFGETDFIEMID